MAAMPEIVVPVRLKFVGELAGLTVSDVAGLAQIMLELQERRQGLGPQLVGDLEVRLPGHDQPIPLLLNDVGNYEVFVALDKPAGS